MAWGGCKEMKVQDLDKVIDLLHKIVDYAFNNPPEQADHFDPYATDVYESENPRFASLAKITVKLADKIYIKAGGENIDDTRNDLTPFGSAFLNVIDGVVCALIIRDAYEFGWCYDLDSFLEERILQVIDFCDMSVHTHPQANDPVMDRIFAALSEMTGNVRVPYDPAVHYHVVQHQALQDEDDLMERWARLAGVRR